jgi:5-methylthioadenosine/S-adenosylhomocysteine deaminase
MSPESNHDPQAQITHHDPDLIIQGGMVITMKEGQAPIPEADLFIGGGEILEIHVAGEDETPRHRHAEIIDAKGAIVMPGLINGHSHGAMTLFRGLADDLPLKNWLFEKIFPAEARHLSPETVYWGALLGCLEMTASGTTTMVDGYFFQDSTVRAVHEAGLRALAAQGVIDFPAPGVPEPRENLKVGREFIERWLGFSERITPGLFCHSPLTCSGKTLQGAREISAEFGLPLQIHLSETTEEVREVLKVAGKRPVHYLDQLGLLDERLIAAHAVHLEGAEILRLKERGVKVVHVPESNMKLGSGVARISEMVGEGMVIGLGTDGCSSNNNLDLISEMDTAAKLSKLYEKDPTSLSAETVLKMATIWGAGVIGLENEIGTLERGKKADIIVVDLQRPHLCPMYDPFSALVYAANGADVRDVIVHGKVLMKNREFLSLDATEIRERVRGIARNIS